MEIKTIYIFLAFLFGVIVPLYSVLKGGQKVKDILSQYPEYKALVYRQSIIFQWVAVALILIAVYYYNDISQIGLDFISHPLWIIGLIGITLLWLWGVQYLRISDKRLKKLTKRYKDLRYLIPSNKQEYRWVVALSYTAGICEEIIFRGFFFWQLNQFIPLIPSILMVNLLFGLSHYGTQKRNMILASLFGVLASCTFIWTGSLWIAIVLHIMIDLYSLTEGKKYLERNTIS